MQREELSAWLRLTLSPGVGNITGRKLLATFGLPQAIFGQTQAALNQVVDAKLARGLLRQPAPLAALLENTWRWLQAEDKEIASTPQSQRCVVTLGDANYPQALLQMEDPPLVLYLLGRGSLGAARGFSGYDLARSIALVGSRNPTAQGADNAYAFGHAMAQAGLTVISGMALGVDGKAHEGALDGASQFALATIAVVGTGLDRVYPRRHLALAHRIAEQGLIISEYPIGTPPLAANFPKRNRLIASLSQGTLVVEAALLSGSLITAKLAADMGREVFAIPGSIHSGMSRGCHALIRQGAKLVETAQDILEELHLPVAPMGTPPGATTLDVDGIEEDESLDDILNPESSLLTSLGFDPVSLDALQARCGLPTPQLLAQLMELELLGQVARLPGGLFQRIGLA